MGQRIHGVCITPTRTAAERAQRNGHTTYPPDRVQRFACSNPCHAKLIAIVNAEVSYLDAQKTVLLDAHLEDTDWKEDTRCDVCGAVVRPHNS